MLRMNVCEAAGHKCKAPEEILCISWLTVAKFLDTTDLDQCFGLPSSGVLGGLTFIYAPFFAF